METQVLDHQPSAEVESLFSRMFSGLFSMESRYTSDGGLMCSMRFTVARKKVSEVVHFKINPSFVNDPSFVQAQSRAAFDNLLAKVIR